MALDNIELDNLQAGDDVATDLIATDHYQYVKLTYGAAGTANEVTSTSTNPFPVALSDTDNAVLDTIAANTNNLNNCIVQDDAPFTPATGYLMMIGGEFDDAGTDSVDEGDAGNIRITANRSMHTTLRDAAGNERGLNIDANGEIGVTLANTSLPAGTNAIGKLSANSGVDIGDVDVTSCALPTGAATSANQTTANSSLSTIAGDTTSLDGKITACNTGAVVISSGTVTANLGATDNAVLDQIELNTGGSTSHYRNIDANAEAAVKASAGTLKWMHAMNMTAAVAYVHLYDATAASVTPGTTTPDFTFALPTQGDTNGAGFVLPAPIEFSTAITLVCTTTLDGSTGDPGTNGVIINAGYV